MSAITPVYRVLVHEMDVAGGTFGPGDLIAEFDRPHSVGYADFLNNVPEAFFTLHQGDPKIQLLRSLGGLSHVYIYRGDTLVWAGTGPWEWDATADDVIFYCYGYLGELFWLLTDWQQSWSSSAVGTIVSDLWTRATTMTKSRLAFITNSTISTTAVTLPAYEAFYKRILFVYQEMAAIVASDTTNRTSFWITHSTTPAFNFDVNRGTDRTGSVRWRWGDSLVKGYREYAMPLHHRNDIRAVGQQPRDVLLRKSQIDTVDRAAQGLMMEPLFLAWVRDEDELNRVSLLRAEWAKRDDVSVVLDLYAGKEPPPLSSGARFGLADQVHVKIDRGLTNIDKTMQVFGYMVAAINGQEKMRVHLQDPA